MLEIHRRVGEDKRRGARARKAQAFLEQVLVDVLAQHWRFMAARHLAIASLGVKNKLPAPLERAPLLSTERALGGLFAQALSVASPMNRMEVGVTRQKDDGSLSAGRSDFWLTWGSGIAALELKAHAVGLPERKKKAMVRPLKDWDTVKRQTIHAQRDFCAVDDFAVGLMVLRVQKAVSDTLTGQELDTVLEARKPRFDELVGIVGQKFKETAFLASYKLPREMQLIQHERREKPWACSGLIFVGYVPRRQV